MNPMKSSSATDVQPNMMESKSTMGKSGMATSRFSKSSMSMGKKSFGNKMASKGRMKSMSSSKC